MNTGFSQALANVLDIDLALVPANDASRFLDVVTDDAFLAYIFDVLLERAPDASGLRHYRLRLALGHDRRSVVVDLLASGEYRERAGLAGALADDHEAFVNRVYLDVLGRWPDPDGMATYARIAGKRRGRAKVLRDILRSPEAIRRGGGRHARIEGLAHYVRWAGVLRLAAFRTIWRRVSQARRQFARIELMLLCQVGHIGQRPPWPAHIDQIDASAAPLHVVPEVVQHQLAVIDDPQIEQIDAETAKKLEVDGFVFKVATRDARRKASIKG